MKCDMCQREVTYLYTVQDGGGRDLEICSDCSEGQEVEEQEDPEDIDFDDPDVEVSVIAVTMDSGMFDVLEKRAEIEGYSNIEAFVKVLLFEVAVATKIEDLGELETTEEKAAFTDELVRWLILE